MDRHRMKVSISWIAIVATLGALLLSACTPALPREQVEQELVPFMLNTILPQPAGGPAHPTQSGGHRWAEAPANASIVVWAPPVASFDNSSIEFLKSDEPNKVWWYADQQLVEVTDKQEAIRQFREAHFSGTSPTNREWGYYEFGILSLSHGNREARVYVGISCGPLCGNGMIYTLQRDGSGVWKVKGSEMKWIS